MNLASLADFWMKAKEETSRQEVCNSDFDDIEEL